MKKKIFTILTCVGLLLCLIPTNVNANVDARSSGSTNGRSYATTLLSNNSKFTAYTYSSNSGDTCSLYVTANYKKNGVSKQSIWNKAEDSTGYAMVQQAQVPSGADNNKWTSVYSTHKVTWTGGSVTYYSNDY